MNVQVSPMPGGDGSPEKALDVFPPMLRLGRYWRSVSCET
jgi:hypothetical protein